MLIALLSCAALVAVLQENETQVTPTNYDTDYAAPQSANGRIMSRWSTGMLFESGVVDDDGEGAYGDIGGGTVCTFDGDGAMIGDTQVSQTAAIEDARGTHALASNGDGLVLIDLDLRQSRGWSVDGVRVAELRAHGAVALTDSDEVVWLDSDDEVARFDAPGCRGLSLDRETDTAWLGCGDHLMATNRAYTWDVALEGGVSRIAYSGAIGGLFVLGADGTTLSAVEDTGTVLWTQTLGDEVLGMVAVGGTPAVALLLATDVGSELMLFDGDTGAMLDSMRIAGEHIRGSRETPVILVYGDYVSYVLDVETSI